MRQQEFALQGLRHRQLRQLHGGTAELAKVKQYRINLPAVLTLITLALQTIALANSTSADAEAPNASLATGRSLVLADFDNRTHDSSLDHSLTQALFLEFSQSPFLSVISERRVTDALRALGRSANAPMSADVARQVCLRTRSQTVVHGSITRAGAGLEIVLKGVDCNTGSTIAEQRLESPAKEDVLENLNRASSRLRVQLGEPLTSVQRFDVPAKSTTTSLEALEAYSLGLAVRRDAGDVPSIPYFRRALAHDPSFPMAEAVLAKIYGNLREPAVAIRYATQAYNSRNRVGERERFQLSGVYFLESGQIEQEIRNYELWRLIYPNDSVAYNNLGNDYAALGQLKQALREYQEAQRLAPSVVGYTNVAGIELALNRFDDAASTLEEAFARQFDGRYLHQTLYWLAFLQGNAPQMRQQVAWAAGKPGDEDPLLSMQADTESYFGHLNMARQLAQRAVDSAMHSGSMEAAALWQINDALREAEVGNTELARRGVASALALSRGRDVVLMGAFVRARVGDCAGAAELVRTLEQQYPNDALLKIYWLPTIHATCELIGGRTSAALRDLRSVSPYELGGAGTFINYLYPAYIRGEIYLRAGDGRAAVVQFQKVLDHRGIVVNFVTGALAHLELARAYLLAGETITSRAEYMKFLTLWKEADPEVPVMLQAKAEYARLQIVGVARQGKVAP